MKWPRGYIQIYTGNGKGKTTAALGLAVRAAGHGLRTYIAQFMKGQFYGELESLHGIAEITIEQFGKNTFVHIDRPEQEDIKMAQAGLAKAYEAMMSGRFQIIILDEILVAIHFRLLTLKQVMEFVNNKPTSVELILTGRYAPAALIEKADLVTEMAEVKHYYRQQVIARDGIER
ncbi:MAG: cob(I)yrinic acid a,c-diamide adenosyltransferase [candidate division KSB1 bacterium]|nr:cob(I)yrinic acid a,c-diamide adenosyltransferase [candidate division KSB1 bacterium]MDZ7335082.1 cob(I)yrinic acid a,c-diamide adenosyltransferase [candidate division KSB1 bacterium]MDZ7356249.1 cob(I)yrinic acid a,c-diamide adenosyltransferase [candidate division KSB1 bacterium]MDZ7375073.1 cob(I)yrinic acid a,c-diamide adenosyltransferase [candidate division KSB1 bacterium]MDZ7400054.1 cob(I)yrinic acid a,c-diamide adenosyltransferase [candidate division KSB1 bacterium]